MVVILLEFLKFKKKLDFINLKKNFFFFFSGGCALGTAHTGRMGLAHGQAQPALQLPSQGVAGPARGWVAQSIGPALGQLGFLQP